MSRRGYSIDLRERVIRYVESGGSKVEASEIYAVSRGTIYRWLSQYKTQGDLAWSPPKPYKVRRLDKAALKAYVAKDGNSSLHEMGVVFGVSHVAIYKALKQLGISYKKNAAVRQVR